MPTSNLEPRPCTVPSRCSSTLTTGIIPSTELSHTLAVGARRSRIQRAGARSALIEISSRCHPSELCDECGSTAKGDIESSETRNAALLASCAQSQENSHNYERMMEKEVKWNSTPHQLAFSRSHANSMNQHKAIQAFPILTQLMRLRNEGDREKPEDMMTRNDKAFIGGIPYTHKM